MNGLILSQGLQVQVQQCRDSTVQRICNRHESLSHDRFWYENKTHTQIRYLPSRLNGQSEQHADTNTQSSNIAFSRASRQTYMTKNKIPVGAYEENNLPSMTIVSGKEHLICDARLAASSRGCERDIYLMRPVPIEQAVEVYEQGFHVRQFFVGSRR